MRAGREVQDLDAPCLRRPNGEILTVRQRLEVIAHHWAEHVRELEQAARA
jgi:hypothetical protein